MQIALLNDTSALRRQVARVRQAVRKTIPATDNGQPVDYAISNFELLLETLSGFYNDPSKANFFPAGITSQIASQLESLNSKLQPIEDAAWEAQTSEVLHGFLKQMDDVYSLCLQYGIITFGFDGKIAQEHLASLRAQLDAATIQGEQFLGAIGEQTKKLNDAIAASLNSVDEQQADFVEDIKKKVEQLQPSIDLVTTQTASIKASADAATQSAEGAKRIETELGTLKTTTDAAAKKLEVDLNAVKTAADGVLVNVQADAKQTQESSANAKAAVQDATDAKARITSQLDAITVFYGEIEKHKTEMLEIRKLLQANATKSKEETEAAVAKFQADTTEIVTQNQTLQEQIRQHLHKAVGASLFSAFANRRKQVVVATWIWAGFLVAFTIVAAVYACWFASTLDAMLKQNVYWSLVVARAMFAVPIAFIITFCAAQYSKERRSEEEYAFKSAISLSLESYRELLVKMQKESPGPEGDFIRQLLSEIFDNPVKRLYSKEAEKSPEAQAPTGDILGKGVESTKQLIDVLKQLKDLNKP